MRLERSDKNVPSIFYVVQNCYCYVGLLMVQDTFAALHQYQTLLFARTMSSGDDGVDKFALGGYAQQFYETINFGYYLC